jgi:2-dehydropantoate 2-reductase
MRIVIVGGGAIGRLFGSFLGRGGNDITLIDIDHTTLGALREKGIGLVVGNADHADDALAVPVTALPSAENLRQADLVLLLVKSQATAAAVQDIAHLIGDSCPLLLIQTGLGNVETAMQIVDRQHILLGITYMSAIALSEAKVRQGGQATTYIGELDGTLSPRLEKIAALFNRSAIKTSTAKRIHNRLWAKVVISAAINPVSAILQVPNGSLVSRPESIALMRRLLDEGAMVAKAEGIDLIHPDLYQVLLETCERSAGNLSSMLQDILNETGTEIDAQNGAICRYAEQRHLAVPTHRTMVDLIKLLECWKPGVGQS